MTTAAEATDRVIKLRELPVSVNVSKLAAGLLDLFTDEERTVLRFGMLPAKKMELLEKHLREKFEGLGDHPRDIFPPSMIDDGDYGEDDRMSAIGGEVTDWNLGRLVREAMHELSLGIYKIGDLVV